MERHIDMPGRGIVAIPRSKGIAALSGLLLLGKLKAVVDNILEHALDLLNVESFQEAQFVTVVLYNIRKLISPLKINVLLEVGHS
jgi:hypothetical protein